MHLRLRCTQDICMRSTLLYVVHRICKPRKFSWLKNISSKSCYNLFKSKQDQSQISFCCKIDTLIINLLLIFVRVFRKFHVALQVTTLFSLHLTTYNHLKNISRAALLPWRKSNFGVEKYVAAVHRV